jgi:putative transposase
MSRNFYAEINLHLVWHTKGSLPLLGPEIEPFVQRYLRGRLINTPGVYVREVGGIETHVHIALSVAPTVLISELVGQLKGSCSHETNKQFGRKVLQWQDGYGVVSFGTANLKWVTAYVRNQREHHARGTIAGRLERIVPLERLAADPGAQTTGEPEPREPP